MFKDDINLVQEAIAKYGYLPPLVDLGGLAKPTIADYDIVKRKVLQGEKVGQRERYITLPGRPFDSIDPGYLISNPENGDPPIEAMPGHDRFGTIVCLSVLEHVVNPFEVFSAFAKLLKPTGLLICSTVFSFPVHEAPRDYWRFTPQCLWMLAEHAGLTALEAEFRLSVMLDDGVKEIHTGDPQEVRSVYVIARKQGAV